MRALAVLALTAVLVPLGPLGGAAEAAESPEAGTWTWPVRGVVITPFALSPNRFAPGQHRGIDIAARAGAPVVAACRGQVTFAGRVPGRGRAVTVRCAQGALA